MRKNIKKNTCPNANGADKGRTFKNLSEQFEEFLRMEECSEFEALSEGFRRFGIPKQVITDNPSTVDEFGTRKEG